MVGIWYSPVFTILDGGLAKAGPVQKWGIPASVCAGGEDAVLWGIKGIGCLTGANVHSDASPGPLDAAVPSSVAHFLQEGQVQARARPHPGRPEDRRETRAGSGSSWLTVEGVGVVFFLSRPGRGLAGTLAVLLAFRPVSSSGRLFSVLLL